VFHKKKANLKALPQLKTHLADDLRGVCDCGSSRIIAERASIDRDQSVDCVMGGIAGVMVAQNCAVVVFSGSVARSKVSKV